MAREHTNPDGDHTTSWGGPPKGEQLPAKPWAPPYEPGNPGGPGRGHTTVYGEQRKARRAYRLERMRDILEEVAEKSKFDNVRVMAAVALLNREEGTPGPAIPDGGGELAELSDEALQAEALDLEKKILEYSDPNPEKESAA